MNAIDDKRRTEELLRSLLKSRALIVRQAIKGDWPAHVRGDLRKRPLFWINSADVERMIAEGLLTVQDKGVGLSPETKRRLDCGVSAREIVETTGFVPGGVERPIRCNVRGTTLDRLARARTRQGEAMLSAAQVTAAHRFATDLQRAGEGQIATTDASAEKVDGTRRHDAAERAILARMDAGRSLQAAKEALGPDLARLLSAVLGADERLDAIERAESWSRGTGLAILRLGLDRLSIHYGTVPGQAHTPLAKRRA